MPLQIASVEGVHERRGYPESAEGTFIAYHYFIGCDATERHDRSDDEPSINTGCGMGENRCKPGTERINERSIAIALAGNFDIDHPTEKQLQVLRDRVTQLQKKYGIPSDHVIPHRQASATNCAGKNLIKILWPGLYPFPS